MISDGINNSRLSTSRSEAIRFNVSKSGCVYTIYLDHKTLIYLILPQSYKIFLAVLHASN